MNDGQAREIQCFALNQVRCHAASRGLARDLELGRWLAERRYDGAEFSLPELLAAKTTSIAAILPTRECAATIGPILDRLAPLQAAGLVDELLVVDADSADGTAAIAREHGARAVAESALRPELGPGRGKGDAMWRAAAATEAELLVFLDADTVDFDPGFVTGLVFQWQDGKQVVVWPKNIAEGKLKFPAFVKLTQ